VTVLQGIGESAELRSFGAGSTSLFFSFSRPSKSKCGLCCLLDRDHVCVHVFVHVCMSRAARSGAELLIGSPRPSEKEYTSALFLSVHIIPCIGFKRDYMSLHDLHK
jgi:hypothetical protein